LTIALSFTKTRQVGPSSGLLRGQTDRLLDGHNYTTRGVSQVAVVLAPVRTN